VGTLNPRGLVKTGKREEIETWMKHNNVRIMALQETHVKHNTRVEGDAHVVFQWGKRGERVYSGCSFCCRK
jgi:hypothetical protein